VTFQAPLLLALLGLVPFAAAAYVLAQRRRRRFAVRYTNVDVLAGVAAGRAWARHLPALFALLALAALLIALARPQHTVAAQRHEATVMLLTDTSGSMTATDVKPTRLAAAQAAARTFARKVPDEFRLGLITFGSAAQELAAPTTDHQRVLAAIDSMQVHGGTAMGDGINLAVNAARVPVPDGLGGARRLPAAIVMLSDGASTRGSDPVDVVGKVKKYKIPIYTVALGTANGELKHVNKRTGAVTFERVPPDPLVLQDIARDTGGEYFAAPNAQRLSAVYRNLSTRLAHVKEHRQVTSAFAGGALVLLLAGAGFGLVRGGRLP
jgi:Ca-activated chloride channel family protein